MFGRLTEETLPNPGGGATQPVLHWTYDADNNVASFQDGNGNISTYLYNDRNELIQENGPSPDGGHTAGPVWQWQYNAAGELTETIDPTNRVTQYALDGDGDVIQTIAPNLTTGGPGDATTSTWAIESRPYRATNGLHPSRPSLIPHPSSLIPHATVSSSSG